MTHRKAALHLAALLALAASLSSGCKSNASANATAGQYHEPYVGVDFSYPATWKSAHEEHVLFEATGPRDCALNIVDMDDPSHAPIQGTAADLRQQAQTENPAATIIERHTWAGSEKPAAGFEERSTDKHGNHIVAYNSFFTNGDDSFMPTETMREGDAECAAGLKQFESTLRFSKPVH